MVFVYFTKTLQKLDIPGLVRFFKEVGLDGADLAVRPGYPVNPENALSELPKAAKTLRDEGLRIGLVTAPTDLIDPASTRAKDLFEACGKAGVPAIKLGYFPYRGRFDADLADARRRLTGFAKLAELSGVRACYHTHSGGNIGANGAGLRLLLQDFDPHHVGAFLDTGHVAVGGGPIRMELDLVRPWLSLVAIKDILWEKDKTKPTWRLRVVPAGDGMVRWDDFTAGIKECRFNGTICLHGEYEAKDLAERKQLAQRELQMLKSLLA